MEDPLRNSMWTVVPDTINSFVIQILVRPSLPYIIFSALLVTLYVFNGYFAVSAEGDECQFIHAIRSDAVKTALYVAAGVALHLFYNAVITSGTLTDNRSPRSYSPSIFQLYGPSIALGVPAVVGIVHVTNGGDVRGMLLVLYIQIFLLFSLFFDSLKTFFSLIMTNEIICLFQSSFYLAYFFVQLSIFLSDGDNSASFAPFVTGVMLYCLLALAAMRFTLMIFYQLLCPQLCYSFPLFMERVLFVRGVASYQRRSKRILEALDQLLATEDLAPAETAASVPLLSQSPSSSSTPNNGRISVVFGPSGKVHLVSNLDKATVSILRIYLLLSLAIFVTRASVWFHFASPGWREVGPVELSAEIVLLTIFAVFIGSVTSRCVNVPVKLTESADIVVAPFMKKFHLSLMIEQGLLVDIQVGKAKLTDAAMEERIMRELQIGGVHRPSSSSKKAKKNRSNNHAAEKMDPRHAGAFVNPLPGDKQEGNTVARSKIGGAGGKGAGGGIAGAFVGVVSAAVLPRGLFGERRGGVQVDASSRSRDDSKVVPHPLAGVGGGVNNGENGGDQDLSAGRKVSAGGVKVSVSSLSRDGGEPIFGVGDGGVLGDEQSWDDLGGSSGDRLNSFGGGASPKYPPYPAQGDDSGQEVSLGSKSVGGADRSRQESIMRGLSSAATNAAVAAAAANASKGSASRGAAAASAAGASAGAGQGAAGEKISMSSSNAALGYKGPMVAAQQRPLKEVSFGFGTWLSRFPVARRASDVVVQNNSSSSTPGSGMQLSGGAATKTNILTNNRIAAVTTSTGDDGRKKQHKRQQQQLAGPSVRFARRDDDQEPEEVCSDGTPVLPMEPLRSDTGVVVTDIIAASGGTGGSGEESGDANASGSDDHDDISAGTANGLMLSTKVVPASRHRDDDHGVSSVFQMNAGIRPPSLAVDPGDRAMHSSSQKGPRHRNVGAAHHHHHHNSSQEGHHLLSPITTVAVAVANKIKNKDARREADKDVVHRDVRGIPEVENGGGEYYIYASQREMSDISDITDRSSARERS